MLDDMFSHMSRLMGDFARTQRNEWHEAKLRGFRRAGKKNGQKGFTLVELLVAMTIFAIFSTMMIAALTQFMRTSQQTMQRTQSATRIATSTEQIMRFTQYAEAYGTNDDGSVLYLLLPGYAVGLATSSSALSTSDMCARITFDKKEGTLMWASARLVPDVSAGATTSYKPITYSGDAAIGSGFLDKGTRMFAIDGSTLVYTPTNGAVMYGREISTTTAVKIAIRNYKNDNNDVTYCGATQTGDTYIPEPTPTDTASATPTAAATPTATI